MRALHLTNLYPPSIGGIQSVARWLSEGMAAAGHDVTVFTSTARDDHRFYAGPTGPDLPAGWERRDGVRIRRFPIRDGLARIGPRGRRVARRVGLGALVRHPLCPGALPAIPRARPDWMLAFNAASSFSHYAALARRTTGIPFALVPALHPGSGWSEAPPVAELLRGADLVLPFTEHEGEAVLRRGVAPERVRVVAPGVPAAAPVPRAAARARLGLGDGPIVGFVGRQVEGKGIEALLDALPRVLSRRGDARLLLAGRVQGSFAAERAARLRALGARLRALGARGGRVVALDAFDAADAPAVLAACDVVAVPSASESFGLVYLEAWLQERPVVALRGGPPACLVRHGEDGWLVPPDDPVALADALVALLADPALCARLGRAGRQRALERYSVEAAVAATRVACESLAAPAAQARAQRSTAAGASSHITRSL